MDKYLAWLPIFYYWANLYRMTNHSSVPYVVMGFLVGVLGFYRLISDCRLNRRLLTAILLLYAITGFLNWYVVGNVSFLDIISSLLNYGIFIVMLSFPVKYLMGLISFILSLPLFVAALSNEIVSEMLTSSRNYISVLAILSVSLYYIGIYNSCRKLCFFDVIPSIICLVFSIMAMGRGGIISSALLFLLVFLIYLIQIKKSSPKSFVILFIILLAVLSFLTKIGLDMIDELSLFDKFEERGMESSRVDIWNAYFVKAFENPFNFLFGSPIQEIPLISSFDGNCHNSFIQLHAYNGAFMFAVFFFMLFKSVKIYCKEKAFVLLVILVTIFVRGMTDKFIFGQYGMPIMLYLVAFPFGYSKKFKKTYTYN